MKSSFFQKATAIVCGAATIASLSVAAFTASAEGANVITADQIYAEPGQKGVAYSVKLVGNTGFNIANFSLVYDSRLKLQLDPEGGPNDPLYEVGYSASESVFTNPDELLVGYGVMSNKKVKGDDTMLTVFFDIPADAKPGDTFALKFDKDLGKVAIDDDIQEFSQVDGWIKIKDDTKTTTTETTTSQTTTSETTTSETTTSETTTSETTSKVTTTVESTTASQTTTASETTGAGSGTTSASGSQAPASTTKASATTTKAANTTKAAGTTKQGANTTNGSKTNGEPTGDAGVALALAGLLAAAGTAIVVRKKH